ncbi:hypothetical protein [Bifidobacterium cuniculi]|uniref:hypothetical protein n=1 Tax=Bifidobacterium cuniculi TaxID=1688 RepID=UPI00068C4B7C|nr:hypothetical protein [Bifidobacterium cuniculi]
MSTKVAEEFGPAITDREASKVMARAKALAVTAAIGRNPGHSVADHISFGKQYHGIDTLVVMSVTGRDGSEVAAAHEFGAYNVQARRFVPGHHVMQRAARG